MYLAILIPALGGEAVSAGNEGLDIVSFVSIVGGWVLLAALWYFVFRNRSEKGEKSEQGPSEED